MMKLLNFHPQTKTEGLRLFCDAGCFLVDATYEQVNDKKKKDRENAILKNYENLVEDLGNLGNPKTMKYVLVKANICRLLEPKLKADGFNVINNGVAIPFPSTGQQSNFHREIAKVFVFKHD